MTPKEIQAEIVKLQTEVGPKAHVGFSLQSHGRPIYVSLYPFGITNSDGYLSAASEDWADALEKIRAEWAEHSAEHCRQTVRNMALAIIRLTSDLGQCTDAALRAEFDPGVVARWGTDACAMANEMAGKGPFAIVAVANANAE